MNPSKSKRSHTRKWASFCLWADTIRSLSPLVLFLVMLALVSGLAFAQQRADKPAKLNFKAAPLQMVLDQYSELTDRTLLQAPGLKSVNITLRNRTELNVEESLQAMETVLAMHGIALLREGEKFLRVVPIAAARVEPMNILEHGEDFSGEDTSELISQMITLTHIEIDEATKAITPLKHPYGQIAPFERVNSILVTDNAATINRIMQILKLIDQPIEAREEPHIIQIRYAKASDIKGKLMEIIAESQKMAEKKSTVLQSKPSGAPGVVKPAVPGVIRARKVVTKKAAQTVAQVLAEVERGIIRGKVQIVADERTNLLIIITRPENMKFFEKIIKVLDVEMAPDVIVKIIRLEYAEAETVATTLNTLMGSKAKGKDADKAIAAKDQKAEGESAALSAYVEQLGKPKVVEKKKSKVGELSVENIKILADKRTNALLIMASKADMVTLEEIIASMDMMLSQVLIEVVIFKITLSDEFTRGIDWIQRAIVSYSKQADGVNRPDLAFAGVGGGGTLRGNIIDPLTATTIPGLSSTAGNLTYFFTLFGLNLDAIISMIASDSRTKILSSPQILTTDNTEATINVTREKYFFKGLKFVSSGGGIAGQYVPDVVMKKVGTKLTVTPHINEKKFVVMEIKQSLEEEGAVQLIQGIDGILAPWPTIDSAELTASVAVRSGETIVLGGLVSSTIKATVSKIPILGSIPLLGGLFRHTSEKEERSEVVVFITPYVLDTPEEIEARTVGRKDALHVGNLWPKGWSDSKLAYITGKTLAEQDKEKMKKSLTKRAKALIAREKALAEKEAGMARFFIEKEKELTDMQAALPERDFVDEQPAVVDGPESVIEAGAFETTGEAPMVLRPQGRGDVKLESSAEDKQEEQEAPSVSDLDPELIQFIQRQEKEWGRTLRKMDKLIEN